MPPPKTSEVDVVFCSHLIHFRANLQKERCQRDPEVSVQRETRQGTGTELGQAEGWGSWVKKDTQKGGNPTKPRWNWVNSKKEKDKSTEDKIPGPKEGKIP